MSAPFSSFVLKNPLTDTVGVGDELRPQGGAIRLGGWEGADFEATGDERFLLLLLRSDALFTFELSGKLITIAPTELVGCGRDAKLRGTVERYEDAPTSGPASTSGAGIAQLLAPFAARGRRRRRA